MKSFWNGGLFLAYELWERDREREKESRRVSFESLELFVFELFEFFTFYFFHFLNGMNLSLSPPSDRFLDGPGSGALYGFSV